MIWNIGLGVLYIIFVCQKDIKCVCVYTYISKVGLYLTDYFMKSLKMAINNFFFNRSFLFTRCFLLRKLVHSTICAFWYQDDTRNIKRGNWEQQIAIGIANYNIYFKNNFNLLAMNVTQINFFYWQKRI